MEAANYRAGMVLRFWYSPIAKPRLVIVLAVYKKTNQLRLRYVGSNDIWRYDFNLYHQVGGGRIERVGVI